MATVAEFWKLVRESKQLLDDLGIPYSKNTPIKLDARLVRSWGITKRFSSNGRYWYFITISKMFIGKPVSEKCIKDTIIHELLHTCPNCFNHTDRWLKYATMLNEKYGYNISDGADYKEAGFDADPIPYKYEVICEGCKEKWKITRRTNFVKSIECNNYMNYTCNCGCTKFKLIKL